jgi:cell wall-associated NlpC family hydrolase
MSKIIEIARTYIGTTENPPDSNKTIFGEWAKLNGLPWCGLFVSKCYDEAGQPLPKIGFRFPGFAGCQTAVAYFRKNNKIITDPQPGDIVFFDWNGDGRFDHTGIFVRKFDNLYFETIEGNTSLTNQSNGGQVMIRQRKYSKNIIFVRP